MLHPSPSPGNERDHDKIDALRRVLNFVFGNVVTRGSFDALPLPLFDEHFSRHISGCSRFHLDKHKRVTVKADQVDLPQRAIVIALNDAPSAPAQKTSGSPLASRAQAKMRSATMPNRPKQAR